jgi:predicted GIY-YIG superfamily endonuclease
VFAFRMREYHFYVYILQSASRRALYIGATSNLHRRFFQRVRRIHRRLQRNPPGLLGKIRQHRQGDRPRKAAKTLASGKEAVADRKDEPQWRELAADWFGTQGLSTTPPARSADGQLRSR